MSLQLEERTRQVTTAPASSRDRQQPDGPSPAMAGEQRPLSVSVTAAAALLSCAAAAWMAGGLFRGEFDRGVTLLGALLGTGLVALSHRTRRPSTVQYMVLPVAMAVGAVLLFAATKRPSPGDLPDLVSEAVRGGGLAQAPVPFDPGWRFILVVVFAILGAASSSLALGLGRVRISVFLPVPVLFATALIHPRHGSLIAGVVSLVLLVSALALAYGAELAQEEATASEFEARRLGRAAAIVAGLAASVVVLSHLHFLFPESEREPVTPARKPEARALQADRVLFTVASDQPGPWRTGVLDVYDKGLLLPPFDRRRLKDLTDGGDVPAAVQGPTATTARFTLVGTEGHEIPNLANSLRAVAEGFTISYDTRTQLFRLADLRATSGLSYTVEAPAIPEGKQLVAAPPASPALNEFLNISGPPPEVSALLAQAPTTNRWERLLFVRNALHQKVVAANEGKPVEVLPSRVVDMLSGSEATPYEITVAEVLLARWAGVPARMGYGYFGGEQKGQTYEVHPRHGATWLETYFEGHGWVPLTSVPPRAQASISEGQKQANSNLQPSDQLALTLYVPIRLQSVRLLYESIRHWLLVSLPFLAGGLLLWRSYPALLKSYRRVRRRRWAHSQGTRQRIAVAYADFRDTAHDLNLGNATSTPLEFLQCVDSDDEHTELSWLVTRAVWGDLVRDLRPEDAEAAEEMARSLTRRVSKAQPATTRLLALGSTISLRHPYTREIPNAWLWPASPEDGRDAREARDRNRRRLLALLTAGLAVASISALVALESSDGRRERPPVPARIPDRLVPASLGGYNFQREPDAEKEFAQAGTNSLLEGGQVFTVRRGQDVQGYLQAGTFKVGMGADRREVRRGILDNLATGRFEPLRRGSERVHVTRLQDQTFQVWFSPDGQLFQLFVTRRAFADADAVFTAILDYQKGEEAAPVLKSYPSSLDPRRGGEDP